MDMEDITEAVARMASDLAKLRKRQDKAPEYSQRDFALWVRYINISTLGAGNSVQPDQRRDRYSVMRR